MKFRINEEDRLEPVDRFAREWLKEHGKKISDTLSREECRENMQFLMRAEIVELHQHPLAEQFRKDKERKQHD